MKAPEVAFNKLSEVSVDHSTTTLLFGGSKVGKTFFAGTAGDRTLYIYFRVGEGIATLKSPLFQQKVHANPITVCIDESDEGDAYDKVTDTIDYAIEHMSDQFDTIVVDEATAFRRVAMRKGLELSNELRRSKTLTKMAEKGTSFFIPALQDYGMEMELVEWFVATYTETCKRVGKHLLIIAHVRETFIKPTNDKGEPIPNAPDILAKIRPGFTGKTFPDDVTAYFDNVFFMERVGTDLAGVHRIRTVGSEILVAGTRYAGVFRTVEPNPNFLDFVARIKKATSTQEKK